MTRYHVLRPVFDVNVRRNALVFHVPLTLPIEEAAARSDHAAAIDEGWRICCMHQTAPGSLSDQFANVSMVEHPWHQVATGSRHFVDDHHLRTPDSSRRAREWISIAGGIVEISNKIPLQNIDDVV